MTGAMEPQSSTSSDRPVSSLPGDAVRTAFLVGQGIGHSISPAVFAAAFEYLGIGGRFALLDVDPTQLDHVVRIIRQPSSLGATVTMPYKGWAVGVADVVDDIVSVTGAANLLVNRHGQLAAANTDALAIDACLAARADHLGISDAVVLGAGGAAAAAAWAAARWARSVTIVARRVPAARQLADRLAGLSSTPIGAGSLADIELLQSARVFLHATPIGMHDSQADPLASIELGEGVLVYDLVYRREGPTALQRRARRSGADLVDGVTHLMAQAIPNIEFMTGGKVPMHVVRQAVEEVLGDRDATPDRQ